MSSTYYKVAAENRKARFDYTIIDVYKAGLVLTGNEVKSIRRGNLNLADSFGRVEHNEIWLYNVHVSPYSSADQRQIDPLRPRKVLLEKSVLVKLVGKVAEKGLTLVPLKVYFDGNWAKVDLALAKAKKKYEKRDTLRRRTAEREIEEAFKGKGHDRKNK
ncbi:MAG: SsrA-binding protein SmpB [Candidatus Margulisiibacteriota bacterium]